MDFVVDACAGQPGDDLAALARQCLARHHTAIVAAVACALTALLSGLLSRRGAADAAASARDGWEREVESIHAALQSAVARERRARAWASAARALSVLYPLALAAAAGAAVHFGGGRAGLAQALAWVPAPWLLLPAPEAALLLAGRALGWRAKRLAAKRGALAEQRAAKLTELKETLPVPFAEAVALLQKYDPQGDHRIFTDQQTTSDMEQRFAQERRELIAVIDAMLNVRFCKPCFATVLANVEPVKGVLARYQEELKQAPVTRGEIFERFQGEIAAARCAGGGAVAGGGSGGSGSGGGDAGAEVSGEEDGLRRRTTRKESD